MSELPITTEPLPSGCELAPEQPLAAVVERVSRSRHPLWLVRRQGEVRALLDSELRSAVQDRPLVTLTVWDVARRALIAADPTAAHEQLTAWPQLEGVLVAAPEPVVVRRVPPRIDTAVVMAGGLGQRLRPMTDTTPKPLLEVAGEPLLGRILRHLAAHGVRKVWLSVNYLKERIRAYAAAGDRWGLEIAYLEESQPLDTGAGLAQMPRGERPFFVVNGDVLTDVNLSALGRQHLLRRAVATVATYLYPAPLPYGVVHRDGERITGIEEKPVLRYPINAGIYAFAAKIQQQVVPGAPLSMVPFLNQRIASGDQIDRFPLVEYWNDVGQPADFERAQQDAKRL